MNRRIEHERARSEARSGMALIATLAILLVVGLLILASAVTGIIDRSVSANQLRSNAAYYVAQTGIDVYKTAIFRNLVDFYDDTGAGWCESPVEGGVVDEGGNWILERGVWQPPREPWTSFGQGEYRVRLDLDSGYLILTAEGRVADARATVQLVASAGGGPASAWDNAILARGSTPGSKAINGNVTVYGSIHIVEGDIDGTVGLTGTAGVFNTYTGRDGGQGNTDITGALSGIVQSTNVDLCARIKIHEGNIYTHGNVHLGDSLEPIYSIHLGNGFVCREREGDGTTCRDQNLILNHFDSDRVYLRYPEEYGINSPYSPFDLGLPALTQAFFDRTFSTAVAGAPVAGCEWLYDGGVVRLPPVIAGVDSATCGDGDGSIQWVAGENGEPGHLVITGHVNIPDADLEIDGPVRYDGKGTILVGQDLDDADAQITFDNGGSIRPLTPGSYPEGSAIALMTSGDMTFGSTAADAASAALLYARGTFTAEKQVIIVGAVVADNFDLGNNVPKFAYHPDVRFAADELCLPGTACAGDGAPQNPGVLTDIAIERREGWDER